MCIYTHILICILSDQQVKLESVISIKAIQARMHFSLDLEISLLLFCILYLIFRFLSKPRWVQLSLGICIVIQISLVIICITTQRDRVQQQCTKAAGALVRLGDLCHYHFSMIMYHHPDTQQCITATGALVVRLGDLYCYSDFCGDHLYHHPERQGTAAMMYYTAMS